MKTTVLPEVKAIAGLTGVGKAMLFELLVRHYGGEPLEVSINEFVEATGYTVSQCKKGRSELKGLGFVTGRALNASRRVGDDRPQRFRVNTHAVVEAVERSLAEYGALDRAEGVAVCPRCRQHLPAYESRAYRGAFGGVMLLVFWVLRGV